jgi:hypothetical protein
VVLPLQSQHPHPALGIGLSLCRRGHGEWRDGRPGVEEVCEPVQRGRWGSPLVVALRSEDRPAVVDGLAGGVRWTRRACARRRGR